MVSIHKTPARGLSAGGRNVVHDCHQQEEINKIKDRLSQGDVGFAELRKDVVTLTEKVSGLTNAAWWLIAVIMVGVIGTIGTALVWVIAQMGKPA